jgi:hypothetical protein
MMRESLISSAAGAASQLPSLLVTMLKDSLKFAWAAQQRQLV